MKSREKVYLIFLGVYSGISIQLNWMAINFIDNPIARVLGGAFGVSFLFLLTRKLVKSVIIKYSNPELNLKRFLKLDLYTYLVFLIFGLGAFGFTVGVYPIPVLVVMAFVAVKVAAYLVSLPKKVVFDGVASHSFLSFLFIISGFAALIYS